MSERPKELKNSVHFPEIGAPLHEREMAAQIIENYLNPKPFTTIGSAQPRTGKKPKVEYDEE